MTKLSVNVDHVATLRQARGTVYPKPVEAARVAEAAGASGITVHLRSDRRHIQESDVAEIRQSISGKLNLEMATTDEMLAIALELRPDQVTLVPERPEEVTTEGGLDLIQAGHRALEVAGELSAAGISVSVFIDPEASQIRWLTGQDAGLVEGFEINTDRYAQAGSPAAAQRELESIRLATEMGASAGLHVYAGHALTTENVGGVVSIPRIEELNIGHFLISRAVIVGLDQAVREMLLAMSKGQAAS